MRATARGDERGAAGIGDASCSGPYAKRDACISESKHRPQTPAAPRLRATSLLKIRVPRYRRFVRLGSAGLRQGLEVEGGQLRNLRRAVLRWGRAEGRYFFWRDPGSTPFGVLVVEILLSKTRAEVVAPVATALLERYPTPLALRTADRRRLEKLLFPLGLHRKRARQLIACANMLVEQHDGEVPASIDALMELPAVGRYAAHAVASVAFQQRRAIVDANVARIYGRVFSLPPPPPRLSAATELWTLAERILPSKNAKQFNWWLLDLGGTICTAKRPACERCPLIRQCAQAARANDTHSTRRMTRIDK